MHSDRAIIITGVKGSGKTTKLLNIIRLLKDKGIGIIGFIAVGEWLNGKRNKYTLVDAATEKSIVVCSVVQKEGYSKFGRFYFNPQAIKFGEKILLEHVTKQRVVVIDEVGPFEMEDRVWHSSLKFQLNSTNNILLIAVRESLVSDVMKKYNLTSASIFNIRVQNSDIVKEVISKMS